MRSEPIVEEENPTEVNISETSKEKCLQNQIHMQKAGIFTIKKVTKCFKKLKNKTSKNRDSHNLAGKK